ncbi:hypothetical protein C8R45DRAFT_948074 [Mycena sanguinolenta]|nr:hypothetical protein C8R45DRAFT_948074 [Mycena sanguinolenta]
MHTPKRAWRFVRHALTEGGGRMTVRRADLPAIINLQPKLLHNAIGSLPEIHPFCAINALRRCCEPPYPRSSSRRAQAPKAAPACRRRSRALRACPSTMSHTVKLPMESALSPASTARVSPRALLDVRIAHPHLYVLRSSVLVFLIVFRRRRCQSRRIRRGAPAAVRVHRRVEQAYAAAAVRARMMEADDGESQEYARPRVAACVDDSSKTRIPLRLRPRSHSQSNLGLRCATPLGSPRAESRAPVGEAAVRVHESLSRILVKRRACVPLDLENRELIPFDWDLRSTSAQARGSSEQRRWRCSSRARCRIHHSRSPASAWTVSPSLGLSVAIFLDLFDTARSPRIRLHSGHVKKSTSQPSPLYARRRMASLPLSLKVDAPAAWAEPASDAVDDRARAVRSRPPQCRRVLDEVDGLALSLENTAAATPLTSARATIRRSCTSASALKKPQALVALSAAPAVCTGRSTMRKAHCPRGLYESSPPLWLRYCPDAGSLRGQFALTVAQRRRRPTTFAALQMSWCGRVDDVLVPVYPSSLCAHEDGCSAMYRLCFDDSCVRLVLKLEDDFCVNAAPQQGSCTCGLSRSFYRSPRGGNYEDKKRREHAEVAHVRDGESGGAVQSQDLQRKFEDGRGALAAQFRIRGRRACGGVGTRKYHLDVVLVAGTRCVEQWLRELLHARAVMQPQMGGEGGRLRRRWSSSKSSGRARLVGTAEDTRPRKRQLYEGPARRHASTSSKFGGKDRDALIRRRFNSRRRVGPEVLVLAQEHEYGDKVYEGRPSSRTGECGGRGARGAVFATNLNGGGGGGKEAQGRNGGAPKCRGSRGTCSAASVGAGSRRRCSTTISAESWVPAGPGCFNKGDLDSVRSAQVKKQEHGPNRQTYWLSYKGLPRGLVASTNEEKGRTKTPAARRVVLLGNRASRQQRALVLRLWVIALEATSRPRDFGDHVPGFEADIVVHPQRIGLR